MSLLSQEAKAEGFHVDSASADELKQLSEVSPITINAAVWRGKDDDEAVASVMDGADHLGLAWLTFSESEEPERTARFREKAMRRIMLRWPATLSLPIMPTGSIPNPYQLQRTNEGYKLRPEFASNYQVNSDSPLVAR